MRKYFYQAVSKWQNCVIFAEWFGNEARHFNFDGICGNEYSAGVRSIA